VLRPHMPVPKSTCSIFDRLLLRAGLRKRALSRAPLSSQTVTDSRPLLPALCLRRHDALLQSKSQWSQDDAVDGLTALLSPAAEPCGRALQTVRTDANQAATSRMLSAEGFCHTNRQQESQTHTLQRLVSPEDLALLMLNCADGEEQEQQPVP